MTVNYFLHCASRFFFKENIPIALKIVFSFNGVRYNSNLIYFMLTEWQAKTARRGMYTESD